VDWTLVHDVSHEKLHCAAADPVIGLELANDAKLGTPFDSTEEARTECANALLANL
jgi:hypothetical protein